MNNEEILKTLDIKILKNFPLSQDVKIIGTINGFFIYPYSYYWIVKGKMPLNFADELYEFRNTLGIRVGGNGNETKPIKCCTSDEFEAYKEEQSKQYDLIGMKEFCKRLQDKEEELMKEKTVDFYVAMYHIDKLEGLKKVVDTIKKYDIKTEW